MAGDGFTMHEKVYRAGCCRPGGTDTALVKRMASASSLSPQPWTQEVVYFIGSGCIGPKMKISLGTSSQGILGHCALWVGVS